MATKPRIKRVRVLYAFIKEQCGTPSVQTLCRVLDVAASGDDAWLKKPLSHHASQDARLLGLIRASFVASQGIYRASRVFLDLREAGETCSKHRVARLTCRASCAQNSVSGAVVSTPRGCSTASRSPTGCFRP